MNVQHSQCLFFAGTFEPAYTATVSALSQYVQPTTNRRNVYVLSEHLEEALGVPPTRGFFTFVPLPEDNVAFNGKTIAQAVDEALEMEGHGMGVIDEEKPAAPTSKKKRLSVKVSKTVVLPRTSRDVFFWNADTDNQWQSLSNIRTSAALGGEITPPTSADDMPVIVDKPHKVARRRKSFVTGLFARSSVKKENERQVLDGQ